MYDSSNSSCQNLASTDNGGVDVQKLGGTVEFVVLVNQCKEALVDGLTDHFSSRYKLGVKLVLNGYKGETMASKTIEYVQKIVQEDVEALQKAEQNYGDSWKKRGGVGAYMMLARKWDRIEKQVEELNGYDILKAGTTDTREEGIIDDIRDLRRYLLLVEQQIRREPYNE